MKVAIVHYWLINMRGGEKMLEALLDMFPQADIYTHVYNSNAVSKIIKSHKVVTSHINKLPFAKKLYQLYMPLMPGALLDFNLQGYDLIISSEAGPAKGVVPNPNAYHICYCHSPMRYLWDMYHEYSCKTNLLIRFIMKRLTPSLRIWDISSANLVDRFITNSHYVAKRIRRIYNREAEVVYGPASIECFINTERRPSDYYLFFGQITSYKRADIAIEACVRSGRKLIVAGAGAKRRDINKYKKTGLISFLGRVSDEEAVSLLTGARALLFPGIEDLGLIPIEANAAGCPVIAFRDGGVLDTIIENITGIFFDEQSPFSLIEAMNRFELLEADGTFGDREVFTNHVRQFSAEAFKERVRKIITEQKRV
ncbi:MAG: glycosyltransferase [Treponema sp.]|jgi:glycosyltransferase involved in cell wall biosynthesis|nr:glycosyltransferase [Treponema sp.]